MNSVNETEFSHPESAAAMSCRSRESKEMNSQANSEGSKREFRGMDSVPELCIQSSHSRMNVFVE